jgi:peptidoglycan hydrolase-like protein with peptidoglycan-binding domain
VTRSIPRPDRPAPRVLPAVVAAALVGVVVVAGLAGQLSGSDDATPTTTVPAPVVVTTTTSTVAPTTAPAVTAPGPTTPATSSLGHAISKGMYGDDVRMVQQRLKDLGFEPGPIDGAFGDLTRAAVWAFEKLVLGTPRDEATGTVTDEMWQRMQDPIAIAPHRPGTGNHTEVYLPEQVVAFFDADDRPVLISHMSSGTGEQWCEEVTISPGEIGNEHGTAPLKKGECGESTTPGGVYRYYRRVTGVRQSGLGGMWNPVYFNYGIAIHGAINVPLHPASHGCIRIPLAISETFQQLIGDRDRVFVFDGKHEPEAYGAQKPRFNWNDPNYSTTTTAPATPAG